MQRAFLTIPCCQGHPRRQGKGTADSDATLLQCPWQVLHAQELHHHQGSPWLLRFLCRLGQPWGCCGCRAGSAVLPCMYPSHHALACAVLCLCSLLYGMQYQCHPRPSQCPDSAPNPLSLVQERDPNLGSSFISHTSRTSRDSKNRSNLMYPQQKRLPCLTYPRQERLPYLL